MQRSDLTVILVCSFDFMGKTYEYSFTPSGGRNLTFGDCSQLYALIGPASHAWSSTISPKEFKTVRVQSIKPWREKEFSGDLKEAAMLFSSDGPGDGFPLYNSFINDI